jgi:C4-dicarboxylate-specific signal transduction histidine kinase
MTTILDTIPAVEALQALGGRLASFDAADGRLLWRTAAFETALPGLTSAAAPPTGVTGLAEGLADLKLAHGPISTLITSRNARAVFDARLARSGDGRRVFVELHDAAERQAEQRRRLEDRERLLLSSRVLSVGEMASMLAHELNQPIGSIVNLLRGLKAKLARGTLTAETGEAALAKGIDQALYASGVITRIRTFVDQRQPRVEPLDLARLARDTLGLLDWEIERDHVSASAELPPVLPVVLGDQVMIQQVLVNLARNALDAMRADGPDRRLAFAARAGAREVELQVRDSGPGVGEEAAAKMFSPFYSTKADGMGVGLGLCRSIVELHGGRLWHSAAEGGGSLFHLALPRAEEAGV